VGKASPDLSDALGWIAERVSRIKLKHNDPSGFGAFEAFETISLGILGKRASGFLGSLDARPIGERAELERNVPEDGSDFPNLVPVGRRDEQPVHVRECYDDQR